MCPRAATTGNPTNTAPAAVDENNGAKVPSDNLRIDDENHTVGTTSTGLTINLAGVDIGSIVKAKGGITEFRGVKQMTLEKLRASARKSPLLSPSVCQTARSPLQADPDPLPERHPPHHRRRSRRLERTLPLPRHDPQSSLARPAGRAGKATRRSERLPPPRRRPALEKAAAGEKGESERGDVVHE